MNKFANLDGITVMIVLVKVGGNFLWFCSDRLFWIMDYERYVHEFNPKNNDFSERFGIGVLNETTVGKFLTRMNDYTTNTDELKSFFESCLPLTSYQQAFQLFPQLFVDFDNRYFYSMYQEVPALEKYVPARWIGMYENFTQFIPINYRYWIIHNHDYMFELTNDYTYPI